MSPRLRSICLYLLLVHCSAFSPAFAQALEPITPKQKALTNSFFVFEWGVRNAADSFPPGQARLLKQLGYDGMEQMGLDGLEARLKALDDRQLRLFTIYTPLNIDPAQPKWDPKLTQALPLLRDRNTILWVFVRKPKDTQMTRAEGDLRLVARLQALADLVQPYGVRVALYPHANFWIDHPEQALAIARRAQRSNAGMVFNLCHWLKVTGDRPVRPLLEKCLPYLFAASINGAEGGATQGRTWEDLIQPLDRGSYDTYGVLRDLMVLGYTGPIGLQCYNIREDPADHLKRSMRTWQAFKKRLAATADFPMGSQWRPLFDGKTLKGWHATPGGDWKVRRGEIVGTNPRTDKRHGNLVTDQIFADFLLSVQFKTLSGNSAVYFRSEEVGGEIPVQGFQAEIDPRQHTGGLWETEGRGWVVKPKHEDVARWFRPGLWNHMLISARGRDISVWINGFRSAELKNDPGRIRGRFALQLHGSDDMHICFRDIKISVLP